MRHWLIAGSTGIAIAESLKATRHSRVFIRYAHEIATLSFSLVRFFFATKKKNIH
jgi:hypothetical protein